MSNSRQRIAATLTALVLGFAMLAPARSAPHQAATKHDSPVVLTAVEEAARNYSNPNNPELELMMRAALVNTMHQSVRTADGTIYIKTGDIPAEWLRDSSAQARPYLLFARQDKSVQSFFRGVIARQGKYLAVDPYANAFTESYKVWEEKFELDSLAYPIDLAWMYWKVTGDRSIFTGSLSRGFDAALATMEKEQDHPRNSQYRHAGLPNHGAGNAVAHTGMIWTGFRPSDDACKYNFLIPAQMYAVVALGELAEIESSVYNDSAKAARALELRRQVNEGIQRYGVVHTQKYGDVYAYEVDGLGGVALLDDANIPSLLSAPYIGYLNAGDPLFQNTRRFVLSTDNPNYHKGSIASGIGSEHTHNGNIWPLSLLMQWFTADTPAERQDTLKELLASDPGDHKLHESFDPNNVGAFTRRDFGWPNALFSEFVLTTYSGMPPLPVPPSAAASLPTAAPQPAGHQSSGTH
jgi:hypothetical protein